MPMFHRAMLSLLTTPAEFGGLSVGQLIHDRFWPEFLKPQPRKPSVTPPPAPPAGPPFMNETERILHLRRQRRESHGDSATEATGSG